MQQIVFFSSWALQKGDCWTLVYTAGTSGQNIKQLVLCLYPAALYARQPPALLALLELRLRLVPKADWLSTPFWLQALCTHTRFFKYSLVRLIYSVCCHLSTFWSTTNLHIVKPTQWLFWICSFPWHFLIWTNTFSRFTVQEYAKIKLLFEKNIWQLKFSIVDWPKIW